MVREHALGTPMVCLVEEVFRASVSKRKKAALRKLFHGPLPAAVASSRSEFCKIWKTARGRRQEELIYTPALRSFHIERRALVYKLNTKLSSSFCLFVGSLNCYYYRRASPYSMNLTFSVFIFFFCAVIAKSVGTLCARESTVFILCSSPGIFLTLVTSTLLSSHYFRRSGSAVLTPFTLSNRALLSFTHSLVFSLNPKP